MNSGDLVAHSANPLYRGIILSCEENDYKQVDSHDQIFTAKKFETFRVFWFADRKIFKHTSRQLIPVINLAE